MADGSRLRIRRLGDPNRADPQTGTKNAPARVCSVSAGTAKGTFTPAQDKAETNAASAGLLLSGRHSAWR
ncbi:hypothetical protein GCM10009823_11680 [Brevibacterium salitolerans]|uniref:Uncharacterized protein n=1 Tax=Brevibacterium salitolerans TaxID=1403566 RepID=A0ABP5I6Z5_9MICO